MKSAYELAMERLEKENPSGPALNDEQKAKLSELDEKYQAKIAEKKILAEGEMKSAGDYHTIQEIKQNMQRDIKRLEEERDYKKDQVRKGEKID